LNRIIQRRRGGRRDVPQRACEIVRVAPRIEVLAEEITRPSHDDTRLLAAPQGPAHQ